MRLRYLDGAGSWHSSWPPPGTSGTDALEELPYALELIVEHRRYGELRRLLRLPDVLPEREQQVAQPDQADESAADSDSATDADK
jgi:general secretion pathway protein J